MVCEYLKKYYNSSVKEYERAAFFYFVWLFAVLTVAQTLGLAGSESLFLANLGSQGLPLALASSAVVSVLGSLIYTHLSCGRDCKVLFAQMLGGAALLITLGSFFCQKSNLVLYLLFAGYYLTTALLINHYWIFAGQCFDTLASKRLFPLFTVGASLGGLTGSLFGELLNRLGSPAWLIAGWGLSLAGCAWLTIACCPPLTVRNSQEEEPSGGQLSHYFKIKNLWQKQRLSLWLLISAAAMIGALFTAQYIYSDIFASIFPSAQALATFMNIYLAISNFVEIIVELAVTPTLISRLGVARANLVHPFTTVISFIYLMFFPGLSSAVTARANRELLDNALSQPVRSLVYNALPRQFRAQIRSILEGTVIYSGMAITGLLLWIFAGVISYRTLVALGLGLALIYFLANALVTKEYLNTIAEDLRQGRLDFEQFSQSFGSFDTTRLAKIGSAMLAEQTSRPSYALINSLNLLAKLNITEPLIANIDQRPPQVRCCLAQALGEAPQASEAVLSALCRLTADPHRECVAAALKSLGKLAPQAFPMELERSEAMPTPDRATNNQPAPAEPATLPAPGQRQMAPSCWQILGHNLRLLINDENHQRRILAASATSKGTAILREMLGLNQEEITLAVIDSANVQLQAELSQLCFSPNSAVAAAALKRLVETCRPFPLTLEQLQPLFINDCPQLRCAAMYALAAINDQPATTLLASALNSANRRVRDLAINLLAQKPEALSEASQYLFLERDHTISASAQAIGHMPTAFRTEILRRRLQQIVDQAWQSALVLEAIKEHQDELVEIQKFSPTARNFIIVALENSLVSCGKIALNIIAAEGAGAMVDRVRKTLQRQGFSERAEALELLSNLSDRQSSGLLVLLWEEGPLKSKIAQLPAKYELPANLAQALQAGRNLTNRWVQLAFSSVGHREILMDRLLFLRKIPIFANMSLDQLEAINKIVAEIDSTKGEIIIGEGDLGSQLYMLISGQVDIFKNLATPQEQKLATMGSGSYFGEMAIIDNEPRSASVVASQDCHLLSLEGSDFKEIIFQMPEIAFEVFHVLASRIRQKEAGKN